MEPSTHQEPSATQPHRTASELAPDQEVLDLWDLWQQPDRWAHLDDDQLAQLTLFGCLHYGRISDEQDVGPLRQLYQLAAERLTIPMRHELLVSVNDAVERGTVNCNAFVPFIHVDPAIGVISSAALNFAMTMPLQDGDPLSGPKHLLSDVVDVPNRELVRVGTLIGLLLLGDRRVTALLDRCWLTLSREGRTQLAHAYSGFTYAATVEFFLDWLEDAQARDEESEFGLVAAAIANARVQPQHPKVLDVERYFAVNVPDAPSSRLIADWTFAEYAPLIADRLAAAYHAESEPTILDVVMGVWELPVPPHPPADLGPIVSALRHGARDVALQAAPTAPEVETLLAWGYFNPAGPTLCRIDAFPVDGTGELLLVRISEHPLYPDYRAIALVPAGPDQAALIHDALEPVFANNGDGDSGSLVGSVPSYVQLVAESPIDRGSAARLLQSAIAAAGARWGEPPDYGQEIESLLRAWSDPWAQAKEAVNEAFDGLAARRLVARIQLLEAGQVPALHDAGGDGDTPEDESEDATDMDELFDVWFALATQPAYVERIAGQMGTAWTGSLMLRAGAFS
jgi:hypothetical protein